MTMPRSLLAPLCGLLWLVSQAAPAADEAKAAFGGDRFLAGDDVVLAEDVGGDAFVAAGRGRIDGRVRGDAVVTGGNVEIRGVVEEDVYAAGGDLRVDAVVNGNLRAAGGSVVLEPGTEVAGNATLAGGSIDLYGRVGGHLQAFGGRVNIDGEVTGDVEVAADDIRLGPRARIGGRLLYRSPNPPSLADGAVVSGGIEKKPRPLRDVDSGLGRALAGVFRALWFAGVLLLGVVLVGLFPNFTREAAATVVARPLASLGLGLLLLLAVPLLAVALIVTIIGIPLGFAVLLGYGLLLMLGYLTGALALGDLALGRARPAEAGAAGWRMLFLLLALVVIALLRRVPWVGDPAVVLLFLAGLGAFALRVLRGYRA